MARVDNYIEEALKSLGQKPPDNAKRPPKQAYSQKASAALALAFAAELRDRGLTGARPGAPGELDGGTGAERRMGGGIGAKKVDVTWATEESGLLLAISLKTINFRDRQSGNFQKNLTNRRGDMLIESVTLHRRFPYAVLAGFLVLDHKAANDDTPKRNSTFENAHHRYRMFTGRKVINDPDEMYERLYIVLHDANAFRPRFDVYLAGKPDDPIPLDDIFTELVRLVEERNSDFYEMDSDGHLTKI